LKKKKVRGEEEHFVNPRVDWEKGTMRRIILVTEGRSEGDSGGRGYDKK